MEQEAAAVGQVGEPTDQPTRVLGTMLEEIGTTGGTWAETGTGTAIAIATASMIATQRKLLNDLNFVKTEVAD